MRLELTDRRLSERSSRGAGGLRRPPGRGRSRWESPKGAIMIYSNSKSNCCFSASSCSRIHLRMVFSSKPTVLTQYPRDQKCLPFVCLLFCKYRWIRTALLSFKKPITYAMLNFGGTLRHMWIWSALKLPSNNSTPRCRQRSFRISPTWRLNFPYNFLFRYFGIMTTWYLHYVQQNIMRS